MQAGGRNLRHPIVRYALALAIIVVAGLLRGALGSQFPGVVPFATFFPAVLIATLLGGLGPGLLATLLSALVSWFFWLQPGAPLASPEAAVPVNLTLFVLASLGLVATAEAARRYHGRSLAAERRLRAAEDLALDGFGILEAVRDRSTPSSISDGSMPTRPWPSRCTAPRTTWSAAGCSSSCPASGAIRRCSRATSP